ncbi:hypothetical protein SLEP1_g9279 [Rubroshorea leprosula]|uniref:Uncharacterized protein n=1 Tax=Rubroshorea leprosula TaxID=152421 RepID=A0AAV5IFM8_9ROSI|nr:hypothetical protein SLEP1_g9279 [Rubroshorea leprosula]
MGLQLTVERLLAKLPQYMVTKCEAETRLFLFPSSPIPGPRAFFYKFVWYFSIKESSRDARAVIFCSFQ